MTVPLLHPNPSSNEPAIICLTQRDNFRLLSFVTAIQATALAPQKVRSCREQSIDINLKYLSLSHALSYYTECEYACEPAELLACRTQRQVNFGKWQKFLSFLFGFIGSTVNGFNCISF